MKYSAIDYAKYMLSLHLLPQNEQKEKTKKLAWFLNKNGDIKDWKKIEEVYDSLKKKNAKKKKASVNYFGNISKSEIENSLKNYEVEFNEDKSLIGGIQIKIEDVRIDNSLSGRLAELKSVLNI